MRLEDEIKQKSFRNEFHKLVVNIIYTHSWLMSKIINMLFKHDITPQQYNILRILRGQFPSPASVSLLKSRMLDKMSDASRLVDRLVEKGLVEKKISNDDRRRLDVYITSKGLKLLEKIDNKNKQFDDLLRGITEKEAIILNNLLDKLRG